MKEKRVKKGLTALISMVGGVVLLGGAAYLQLFPMAQPSPDLGEMLSYEVSFGEENVNINETEFNQLISLLKQAEPTRRPSVNDHPSADSYYQINFEVDQSPSSRRVYVYEEDGKVFYEIPYGGIYQTEDQTFQLLSSD